MKRKALALASAIAVMFSMIAGAQSSSLTKANIMIGIVPPRINMLSPINGTYNTNDLSLSVNFTTITTGLYDGGPRYENTTYAPSEVYLSCFIDEPASWVGYSLDGQENIIITGNVTLPEVSLGQHNLTVFASDAFGNYASPKTISFNVVAPFPTTLVIASVIIVSVVVFAVFLLMRKHKNQNLY